MKKLQIKSIKESINLTKVYDIEIKDSHHYIIHDNIISHNSQSFIPQNIAGGGTGPEYAASIILFLTKAQLKDGDSKTGIIVTVKPNKNRFSIPHTIKIHLRFDKGMNAYVGLENFISWEACGITVGQIVEHEEIVKMQTRVDKEKDEKKKKKMQDTLDEIKSTGFDFAEDGQPADLRYLVTPDTGDIFRVPGTKKGIAVRHLGKQIPASDLFTSAVFTKTVRDGIDEREIRPNFEYKLQEHENLMSELNKTENSEEDILIRKIEIEDDEELVESED